MGVTVRQIQTVNVKVNAPRQLPVQSTSTFIGSGPAVAIANTALTVAQNALNLANTKYDQIGGLIGGSIIPSTPDAYNLGSNTAPFNSLYTDNIYGTIDGGTFS